MTGFECSADWTEAPPLELSQRQPRFQDLEQRGGLRLHLSDGLLSAGAARALSNDVRSRRQHPWPLKALRGQGLQMPATKLMIPIQTKP